MKWPVVLAALVAAGCAGRHAAPAGMITVGMINAPTNLDPGVGLDEASQKLHQVLDPLLRRAFHSSQAPPNGFNRGHYENPDVDRLIDAASRALSENERRRLYREAQRLIAADVPYVSLWSKTNYAVAQPDLAGIALSPIADFGFLRDVARTR